MHDHIPTPHRINILASLLNKEAQRVLSTKFDISYHEYIILLNAKNHTAMNQMFLVRCTGLTKGAISKILKSLANKRIIEIKDSKNSGRDNAVYISLKGRIMVDKATRLLEKVFASFFEGFESKEKIRAFDHELDKLIIGLEKSKKI